MQTQLRVLIAIILRSLAQGIQAFQSNCVIRARESATFASSIQAEIIEPLNSLLKEQETVMKLYWNDTTKLEKEINAVYANLKKVKEAMLGKLKIIEDILYNCEDFRRSGKQAEILKSDPEVKDKMNFKMGNGLREYKEALDKYKSYYAYTKNYEDQCKSSMKIMMKAYQKLTEDRIQTLKDSLEKLIIFETSMNQNNKYDIDQIGKIIFAIDIPQTISSIIEAHATDSNTILSIPTIEMPETPWLPLFQLYEQEYCGKEIFMDYELIVEEAKTHRIKFNDTEYKKHKEQLNTTFTSIFHNTFDSNDIKSLIESLEDRKVRLAFFEVLKEFAESSNPKLEPNSYKAIATCSFIYLDKAYLSGEIDEIYKIIDVTNKIFLAENDNSLLYAIKTHEVWRDAKFWQSAIKNILDANIRVQRGILQMESKKNNKTSTQIER